MMIKKITIYILAVFLLAACNYPTQPLVVGGSPAGVRIISPVDGAQFVVGDFVDVQSAVSGGVDTVTASLLVNDVPYRTDNLAVPIEAGALYQPWKPTEPGTYTLQVRLSDELDSNIVTVIVGATDVSVDSQEEDATPTSEPTATPESADATDEPATETATIAPTGTAPPSATATLPPSATATPLPTSTSTNTSTPAPSSSISGFVFRDENGNGNINPDDTALEGVTIKLAAGPCPASGLTIATTNASGNYTFANLASGQYCLRIDISSLPDIGGTWNPSTSFELDVTLGANEAIFGKNFGVQPIIG